MRRNRLVLLMALLVRGRDARHAPADALPIDPSLLPVDLATWGGLR